MLSVQNNMLAKNASRQLNVNTKKNAKMAEKLSSGYRINRGADDAAGLAISEKMRRQIRGLNQGSENIKDGIGYVQTAEGALNEVHEILQRINVLAVKAANGTNNVEDRAYINEEIQALKAEMARIFSTTTFNEQRIWEPEEVTPIVGYESKPAVIINGYSSSNGDITNASCGVLPSGGLTVNTEDNGIKVTWTGYNGTDYSTELITWEELADKNYRFDISDYFDENNTDLCPNGNKVFSYNINMAIEENATFQQIKDSLNKFHINVGYSITLDGNNEGRIVDANAPARLGDGVSFGSGFLNYDVAYDLYVDSIYNFDDDNDDIIEPDSRAGNLVSKDPIAENNDNGTWSFSFNMKGIGVVTATSDKMTFNSDDGALYKPDDINVWWWYSTSDKKNYTKGISASPGTLATLKNGLTGSRGIISTQNGGSTDTGTGFINIHFALSDAADKSIGDFSISVSVGKTEKESDVLQRVSEALNRDTVLDLYTSKSSDRVTFSSSTRSSGEVEAPVYGTTILGGRQNFWVQAGAESGQHIDIEYESLSLWVLGVQDTDVLTVENASRAINEVKGALQVVSDQRSLFGAYQNRLEHAYNINKNVEENTQASESLIRDTDIADMMMEYSINNILLQAGTSMLAQANQSSQRILELLG